MTQRKRTPHKGQQAAKAGPAAPISERKSVPPDDESDRLTVEVDVSFDAALDEPLLSLPPPARDKMQTLTDESEIERARLRSLQMSSFPPARGSMPPLEPILSMANRAAPSFPPDHPEPPDNPTAPPPPDAVKAMERERGADPLTEMRDRHALGDYTGAMQIADEILQEQPTNAAALACAESCREVLVKMYTARIGQLDKVPVVLIARNQLRWLSLDHRAGFVLSHIDGVSSVEMILDVSGMAPLDCLRILCELVQQRVISFR